jgi:hypothetical protein
MTSLIAGVVPRQYEKHEKPLFYCGFTSSANCSPRLFTESIRVLCILCTSGADVVQRVQHMI